MGSKSSSRSGSKSLVKSVETLLPKGMNLIHVVLLILVGCLLCTMMGSTVEGYTCTVATETGYVITDARVSGDGTGTEVGTVTGVLCADNYSGNPTAVCPRDNGPATLDGCTAASPGVDDDGCMNAVMPTVNPDGICMGNMYVAGTQAGNECAQNLNKTECDETGICDFYPLDELYSYGGLFGNTYDEVQHALNQKRYGCDLAYTGSKLKLAPASTSVDYLPISINPGDGSTSWDKKLSDADWIELASDSGTGYKDFLWVLLSEYTDKWAQVEAGSIMPSTMIAETNIPSELKASFTAKVKACEKAWEKSTDKTMLAANGNRVIMGYNKESGLVCRNTPLQPIHTTSNGYRYHSGEGCPGTVDAVTKELNAGAEDMTCFSDSPCSWADEGIVSNSAKTITNMLPYYGGRCDLPACRASILSCPRQATQDAAVGVIKGIGEKLGLV